MEYIAIAILIVLALVSVGKWLQFSIKIGVDADSFALTVFLSLGVPILLTGIVFALLG